MIAWERVMIMAPCGTQFAGEVPEAEQEQHLPINNLLLFWPYCLYVCFLGAPEGSWLVFMEAAVPGLSVLSKRVWPMLPLLIFAAVWQVAITVQEVLNVCVLWLAYLYGHLSVPQGCMNDFCVDYFY